MDIKKTYSFLSTLKENNYKVWFDENRKWYEEVKSEWYATVSELIKAVAEFEPEMGSLEAKNCVFRINRDVRFSKDKSPYKTNMGAYFSKGGKKSKYSGYYIHIDPVETFLAAGIWQPEPTELQAIRQEIDYHFTDFNTIIEDKLFVKEWGKLEGEKLVSVPKGYEKENPAAEYLKHKSFIVTHKLTMSDFEQKDLVKFVSKTFKSAKPFNEFLNNAIDM
jgi:uncharacterized protein (TIGR02453 family)